MYQAYDFDVLTSSRSWKLILAEGKRKLLETGVESRLGTEVVVEYGASPKPPGHALALI